MLAPIREGQIWLSRTQGWRWNVIGPRLPDGSFMGCWFGPDGTATGTGNFPFKWFQAPPPDEGCYRLEYDGILTTEQLRNLDLITLLYCPEFSC